MQPTDPAEWRQSPAVSPAEPSTAPSVEPPPADQSTGAPVPPERRPRWQWWLLGGVAAVVVAVVLWVTLAGAGVRLQHDPSLEDGLLTQADTPTATRS